VLCSRSFVASATRAPTHPPARRRCILAGLPPALCGATAPRVARWRARIEYLGRRPSARELWGRRPLNKLARQALPRRPSLNKSNGPEAQHLHPTRRLIQNIGHWLRSQMRGWLLSGATANGARAEFRLRHSLRARSRSTGPHARPQSADCEIATRVDARQMALVGGDLGLAMRMVLAG
jgi:hypothetical protein